MYRALTWLALELGIDPENDAALGTLASVATIRLKASADNIVLINDREVSDELRRPDVERAVSLVAKVPAVREALVKQQRGIVSEGSIVVVGRDIGTVVLPDADLKLYLCASVAERARRRYSELARAQKSVERTQVLEELQERDRVDSGRAHSPLRPAADAVMLETGGIGLEEVVVRALELIEER